MKRTSKKITGKKPLKKAKAKAGKEKVSLRAASGKGVKAKASLKTKGKPKKGKRGNPTDFPGLVSAAKNRCAFCDHQIGPEENALFVEEEVGRVFCTEACITEFFNPEIEKLEKEFFDRLSPKDLTPEERESFGHLRWVTLEDPDEVWREKTANGNFRYTLISEFEPSAKTIWCISICLFLRGEPSFLFIAFTTKNPAMVKAYRRGTQVSAEEIREKGRLDNMEMGATNPDDTPSLTEETAPETEEGGTARLAESWTKEESIRARTSTSDEKPQALLAAEHAAYERFLEPTLDTPDEVWSLKQEGGKHYHFIKYFAEGDDTFWFVVLAKETEDEDEIELLDAFPTKDFHLVERYRSGEQEVGSGDPRPKQRFVH